MSLFSDESSVWRGGSLFSISSPLNDLLEKDDFTLEQLLEEDELIQEVKTRNAKLLEFLSQEDSVLKMVEYVVKQPEDTSDEMRTLKYPYMACEVICCDIMSITETLACASDGHVVETLFDFLYEPAPLDPRLAGYFEKIMSMLMIRKPQEMTNLMNRHSDKLLNGFVAHMQSFSVAELFKRLLQPFQCDYMDDCLDFPSMSMGFQPAGSWYHGGHDDDDLSVNTPTAQRSLSWQQDTKVIDLLISNLSSHDDEGQTRDSDVHKHSSEVLVDIIHYGTRAQQSDLPASPTSMSSQTHFALLDYLESRDVVNRVMELAIPVNSTSDLCTSSMTSALFVLSALLSRHTNMRYSATDELPPAVECTVERLPMLCATLKGDDHDPGSIRNQRNEVLPRLGLRRLRLVGLVVLLIQSKYTKVDKAILDSDVISIVLDLLFTFESVNMLHADVESMVIGILENGGPDLLVGLITHGRLLERILDAFMKNKEVTAKANGVSLGYMGHLHRICNVILALHDDVRGGGSGDGRTSLDDMTHADNVIELLEEDQALWKQWEELVDSTLAPINERDRVPLGGVSGSSLTEDPYSFSYNQNEELLNAQFAQMLEASGFAPSDDPGALSVADFDIPSSTDTPMLPEIMNDSSSSDEDDDPLGEHSLRSSPHEDDFDDFDPRSGDAQDAVEAATDSIAQMQVGETENWADFDQANEATPAFEADFDSLNESENAETTESSAPLASTDDESASKDDRSPSACTDE